MTDKPDYYDRAQPLVTAFAIELNEKHGLKLDEVANSLMSGAIALAVGISGKEATCVLLGAIARAVAEGRYDNAIDVETHPLS